jgi:hypothetical protein
MVRPMTERDDDRREAAPSDTEPVLPFGDIEIETERLPDGRLIHYYSWPADAPPAADV